MPSKVWRERKKRELSDGRVTDDEKEGEEERKRVKKKKEKKMKESLSKTRVKRERNYIRLIRYRISSRVSSDDRMK